METERITVLPGAPTIYRSILDHPERDAFDLHTLRVAVTGAADIPVALIREMRAELPFRSILTGYGLTEAGTCTGSRPDDDAETIATTAGRAMAGLEIIIADRTDGKSSGAPPGELLVRGYSVMQGYLDDPEATAAAIDERGFLHTGDLATMDERGYVRIVGRLEGHAHRRRVQRVPGRGRERPAGPRRDRSGRGHRRARRAHGGGRRWRTSFPPRDGRSIPTRSSAGPASASPTTRCRGTWSRVAELPINATGKVLKDELRARAVADLGGTMSGDPIARARRWTVRRVPPDLERAYVEGGWWTDDTLGAMVARQLAAHPASTVAIWSRSRAWQGTYADIDDEARRLVTLLRDLGVQPGEAVAFQLPNWREAVVSFAALALGGYVVVPIVHIYGRKEVAFILEQSGAVAYISPLAYGHVDYGAIVETAAPSVASTPRRRRRCRGSAELDRPRPHRLGGVRRTEAGDRPPCRAAGGRRGARVHLRDDQRSQGRDPRSPHAAQRVAAHEGLDHAGKAQPDGLARHARDRDARVCSAR